MGSDPLLSRLVFHAAGPLGAALRGAEALVARTSRIEVLGEERCPAGAAIYVQWHRHIPMMKGHHGARGRSFLISRSPLLEPMARWGRRAGLHIVRGASGEGGREIRAVLAGLLREGRSIALAVDGPAGPAFQVKPGCVELARALAVPIVPVGYRCTRGVTLRWRWDRSLVPLPGGRVTFAYGEPIRVAPADDAVGAREAVRQALDGLDPREGSG